MSYTIDYQEGTPGKFDEVVELGGEQKVIMCFLFSTSFFHIFFFFSLSKLIFFVIFFCHPQIVIDPCALMHVIGTTMDFVDSKLASEFVFVNPNATGVCGCGESFTTGG